MFKKNLNKIISTTLIPINFSATIEKLNLNQYIFKKALCEIKEIKLSKLCATVYLAQGRLYYYKKEYDAAIDAFEKSGDDHTSLMLILKCVLKKLKRTKYGSNEEYAAKLVLSDVKNKIVNGLLGNCTEPEKKHTARLEFALGQLSDRDCDYNAVIKNFHKAHQSEPDLISLLNEYAHILDLLMKQKLADMFYRGHHDNVSPYSVMGIFDCFKEKLYPNPTAAELKPEQADWSRILTSTVLYDELARSFFNYARHERNRDLAADSSYAANNYELALFLLPNYAKAHMFCGKEYQNRNDFGKACKRFENAKNIYDKSGEKYKANIAEEARKKCEEMENKKGEYCLNNDDLRITPYFTREFNAKIVRNAEFVQIEKLMSSIDNAKISLKINENKRSFDRFLNEVSLLHHGTKLSTPFFHVLRRWNSYTPIVSASSSPNSKGGGYFLVTNTHGIVIDPGFNFLDNFINAGYSFKNITDILITHAHNDHTADLESIITLLYKYNKNVMGTKDDASRTFYSEYAKRLDTYNPKDEKTYEKEVKKNFKKSRRRKRITIWMTQSTRDKYAPMLDKMKSADYDMPGIIVPEIYEGNTVNITRGVGIDKVDITAIPAKHNDLMSDCYCVGFQFKFDNISLVYTGDTGFDDKIEESYIAIRAQYEKDKAENPNHKLVLLAHLGGFKTCEDRWQENECDNPSNISSNAYYDNHLGRLGLIRLVQILKPDVCLISEFGEELKRSRRKLATIFNKVFPTTIFFPMDIGFCINGKAEVHAFVSPNRSKFIPYKKDDATTNNNNNIDFKTNTTTTQIYYYQKDQFSDDAIVRFIEKSLSIPDFLQCALLEDIGY